MHTDILEKNLDSLNAEISEKIRSATIIGDTLLSKTGQPVLKIDNVLFHSIHDPYKEAFRLIDSLKHNNENKLYIFFGAGIGYAVRAAIERENITIIWMECEASIFKLALSLFDYSSFFQEGKIRLLLSPFNEENLFTAFKGLGGHVTTFIPHRPSLSWRESDYSECKFICEKFFRKKDVNIATLSKFETIWTRNLLQNIPELIEMKPVSLLFDIAKDLPIVVCGAGPSLYADLPELFKHREKFILLCVDTALNVLVNYKIEPDLIYSVDPQTINKSYLEGYTGNSVLVFDPTSCYHTLRLPGNFHKGFFTSSPFPLIKLISNHSRYDLGEIPFGGSVSTNAVSLAELMGGNKILFLGQDLSFTDGYAHCRGAVLEERLNQKESRLFRRELHNHRQLYALPKIAVRGIRGGVHHTNEKMQIFRKWFSDRAKGRNWLNLTSDGGIIENIPNSSLDGYFNNIVCDTDKVKKVRNNIKTISNSELDIIFKERFVNETKNILNELDSYEYLLKEGLELSEQIYSFVLKRKESSAEFHLLLKKIEGIDEKVSSKKGLSDIIGLGVQRVILMITEGYDTNLTIEEKKNLSLGIAKKSILLYSGLHNATQLIRKSLKKSLHRIHSSLSAK